MEEKMILIADIVDNVRRVFHILHEKSKQVERQTGLTSPQLWTIKILAEEAPLRVSDLARRLYLHPATVVGILDRLESRGLARRSGSEQDHRVVLVELTDEGRNLVSNAPEVIQGYLVSGLELQVSEDLTDIDRGLGKLVRVLGVQNVSPRLILSPEFNIAGKRKKERGGQLF